jgi:hypothetical protein
LDRPHRQAVLVCITICFVTMVTGISLQLHLLSEAHSEKHDTEHCSLCQQLLFSPDKYFLESELTFEISSKIQYCIDFHNNIYIKQSHHQQFNPRPPPAAL